MTREIIELTMQEAEEAIRVAVENQGGVWSQFSAMQKAQACMGAVALVQALQESGWRIVRPLKIA